MGKIFIGQYSKDDKIDLSKKIYLIGDDIDGIKSERISFADSIMYKYFYKFLAEINQDSIVVLNNILKRKNRSALEYNCIRQYCQQAGEVIAFQDYPIIDSREDFMILYDMIQKNPFWREDYENIDRFENVECNASLEIIRHDIVLNDKFIRQYEELKEKTISEVKKDPDIIPRRLLKFSEKCKAKYGDFDDMRKLKPVMNVGVSQLKVDEYYYRELKKKEVELYAVREKIHS